MVDPPDDPERELQALRAENQRLLEQIQLFGEVVQGVEQSAKQAARQGAVVDEINAFALECLGFTDPDDAFQGAVETFARSFEARVLGVMLPLPTEPSSLITRFVRGEEIRQWVVSDAGGDALRAVALRSRPTPIEQPGLSRPLGVVLDELLPSGGPFPGCPGVLVPVRNHVPARRGFFVLWCPDDGPTLVDKATLRLEEQLPFLDLVRSMLERALHTIGLTTELNARSRALETKNRELELSLEELERSKQRLVQTSKMEAIGRLAAGVAHDFNNILTIIGTSAALAFDEVGGDHPVSDDLVEISNASERGARLTSQLLEFSRQSKGRITRIDVEAQVRNILPMLTRLLPEGIRLSVDVAPQAPPAAFDLGHFEQVLLNLVANAADAIGETGHITVSVASVHRRNALGTLTPWVELRVADDGPGMPSAIQEKIFEPFFTTKEVGRGTGLGLATVYGVVKQAGGLIEVQSAPQKGTTFVVTLPVHMSAHDDDTAPTRSNFARRGRAGPCVLVVEDEPQIRRLAARVLRRDGFEVLEASCAEEAIDVMRTHPDPIEMLLTDVVMPGGNGRALADAVLNRNPDIIVLFMSGYAGDRLRAEGFEALPSTGEFLAKPFTPDALSRAVQYAFQRRPAMLGA